MHPWNCDRIFACLTDLIIVKHNSPKGAKHYDPAKQQFSSDFCIQLRKCDKGGSRHKAQYNDDERFHLFISILVMLNSSSQCFSCMSACEILRDSEILVKSLLSCYKCFRLVYFTISLISLQLFITL